MFIPRKQIIAGLAGFCITIVCGYGMYHIFHTTGYQKRTEINELFQSVVRQDNDRRLEQLKISRFVFPKNDTEVSDSVTMRYKDGVVTRKKDSVYYQLSDKEKDHMVDQLVLLHTNPIDVSVLDSLFRDELKKKGIRAQTAVIYTEKDRKPQYSTLDTSFYASAMALEKIRIWEDTIALEAFVCIPFYYWLNEDKYTYLSILLVWILCMGGIVRLYRKKRHQQSVTPKQEPVPDMIRDVLCELSFNERSGDLTYNEKTIQLKGMQLKIFRFMLNAPDQFRSYEDMKNRIWENGNATNNTVNKGIQRLRNSLSAVPDIAITTFEGNGYQLNVRKEECKNGITRLSVHSCVMHVLI
ncbi:MAG: winged helix-turn-helix domain-containing protein [Prevotellaceae bacterium]|jgi:DNA-binding winged helix-turn-helix (wHTH) protein|nr:winged helix-turn-helix domain-containing protein [Prevotellaceae bacterium]